MIDKEIFSAANPYLKEISKIRKSPTGDRFFVEGTRFVEELPVDCILEVFVTDLEKHREFLSCLPSSVSVYKLSPQVSQKCKKSYFI